MQPNWYDDPWSPAALRWWDGTQWTAHTAARPVSVWQPTYVPPNVDATSRAGRRASVAVVATAVIACVDQFLTATLLHTFVHDFFHQLDKFTNELNRDPNAQPHLHIPNLYVLDALSIVGLIPEIVFIIWFAKAAADAERLGLPHARKPIWAILGFFVPVVSFWFPYQVARDLLPPGDPQRSISGWWWALTLMQGLPSIAVFIASFYSTTTAVILAIPACAMPISVAIKARQLIAMVTERHAQLMTQ